MPKKLYLLSSLGALVFLKRGGQCQDGISWLAFDKHKNAFSFFVKLSYPNWPQKGDKRKVAIFEVVEKKLPSVFIQEKQNEEIVSLGIQHFIQQSSKFSASTACAISATFGHVLVKVLVMMLS